MNTILRHVMASLILWPGIVLAQNTNGNIKVKITQEINGETKTFEGEYENEEQMKSDPNYQEFTGTNPNFRFHFNDDVDPMGSGFFFQLPDNSEPMIFPFDSTFVFGSMEPEEFEKQMEELRNLHGFAPFAPGFSWTFSDSLDEEVDAMIQAFGSTNGQVRVLRRVEVKDVEGAEFGKKGAVAKTEQLQLNDLNFYPNPSNGRFTLRFKVPEQGELAIKIYNVEGKEVFSRFFDQFGGTFSEAIDLTEQGQGIYLLEIRLDNGRLTKKIVVN